MGHGDKGEGKPTWVKLSKKIDAPDPPDPHTIVNTAPWIFTVAASNIDRDFQSNIVLGNGRTFTGSAINFSNLTRSKTYPLVFGKDATGIYTPVSEARNCYPGSLDQKKVVGKIVVCVDDDPAVSRRIKKLVVADTKAKGLILIDEAEKGLPFDSGIFPFTEVGNTAGFQILEYINSTKNLTATILPKVVVLHRLLHFFHPGVLHSLQKTFSNLIYWLPEWPF
ncbi:hypothetical protein ACFX1R_041872 [Malus domestica]